MRNGDYIRQFEGEEMGRVRPIFFMESVEDKAATAEAGRPIFKDVEMVRMICVHTHLTLFGSSAAMIPAP